MNNTPETPQRYICYKLFVFLYSLFVEPHVSEAFLVDLSETYSNNYKIIRDYSKSTTVIPAPPN